MDFDRYLDMNLPEKQSAFLWGARKTGKSYYLKRAFSNSVVYDLLNTEVYWRLLERPQTLREEVLALSADQLQFPIIIDEIQMVPQLLNEVHWLIENSDAAFVLCGSSARKLKQEGINLLGGRAWRFHFFPLTYTEIPNFNLQQALTRGLIPSHYTSDYWQKTMDAYVYDYLTEEIKAESLVRNLAAFSKFLKVAAHSNTELVNYTNIAQNCHVGSRVVKEYYQILVDTLLGYFVEPYHHSAKRKDMSLTPKFYFFDVGVVNGLTSRQINELTGREAGSAFEHFILMELIAHKGLNSLRHDIKFWRTRSGLEVDFVLGEAEVAVEVKIGSNIRQKDLKGLKEFIISEKPKKSFVVCQAPKKRLLDFGGGMSATLIPWEEFLIMLWNGGII